MDWVLSGIVLLANYLIGQKIKWGWVIQAIGAVLWMYYALWYLHPPQYGLVPSAAINFIICIDSAGRWFKDDQLKNPTNVYSRPDPDTEPPTERSRTLS